jgi:predicted lipoprotein with Yx(FWY)xxD motif
LVTTAKVAGLGTILESGQRPVYELVKDPKGHSTCTGGCATIWPPVLVTAKTAHHLGTIKGLGTIRRPDGHLQAALHGHALYFFAGDHTPSHAGGQGVANNFFTVHTNGTLDRAVVPAGGVGTVPSTTTSKPNSASTSTTPTTRAPAPANQAPTTSPPPTSPPVTSPPATTTPTTSPPATTVPPTTTTTAPGGGGGGVGF